MTIPLSSINEGDRARKSYGDLSGLKNSILRVGLIQPIILSANPDGTYSLIAGGRRFRSIKELGITELHHGKTLQPGVATFLDAEEVPEDVRKNAELDENLHRLATSWTEDVLLISDIHDAKKARDFRWTVDQTSEVLGSGYGKSKVALALQLAKPIRVGDEAILSCKNLSDAVAVMSRRKEDEAIAVMNKRIADKTGSIPTTVPLGGSLNVVAVEEVDTEGGDAPDEERTRPSQTVAGTQETITPAIPLSRFFLHGDTLALPWPTVDHIVTDIPYGIDMDNLTDSADQMADTHNVDQNVSMFRPFLEKSYASIKPGGFLVFFMDLQHFTTLHDIALSVGFRVQRWPVISCKTSAARNGAAQYNTTKNYESYMICRKDETSVLRPGYHPSYALHDFAADRHLYSNPFAKPRSVWKEIYDTISFPGQTVLDPFAGEGSACRAAALQHLIPYGIELDDNRYNRLVANMRSVYELLHSNNVTFL